MAKDMNEARRLHLEQYGSALVTNNYLRIALVLVLLALVGVVFVSIATAVWAKSQKRLVLRIDEVQSTTATLNLTSVQNIVSTVNDVETTIPFPSSWEILEIVRFMILMIAIVAAQATFYAIMFGYVATAMIMLVGPVFIPFKILPQMEWMFWCWLRTFIQFAFYQLIAAAYLYVFGEFLQRILGAKNAPLSGTDLAYLFVPLLLTLVTFVLGIIKIPVLTFSIFSGRAGDSVFLRWKKKWRKK